MPNIAILLKQEITRLARREARNLARPLTKASAQFRRDIAELKRRNAKAYAQLAGLQRQMLKGAAAPLAQANSEKARFSARSVASQRRRLGISAADYGKLIGVTAHTIYKWEHGASRPRKAQMAAFVSLRAMGKTQAIKRLEELNVKVPKARTKKR